MALVWFLSKLKGTLDIGKHEYIKWKCMRAWGSDSFGQSKLKLWGIRAELELKQNQETCWREGRRRGCSVSCKRGKGRGSSADFSPRNTQVIQVETKQERAKEIKVSYGEISNDFPSYRLFWEINWFKCVLS